MVTLGTWRRFREAALAEREELVARYEECRARHDEHAALAAEAAREAERCLRTIRELGEMLQIEDQLSLTELSDELRGQRLRAVAADVLWRHFKAGDVLHYKQWLELVVSEGHRVGGRNPAATFLTQIARIETVERVARRTGLYRVVAAAA